MSSQSAGNEPPTNFASSSSGNRVQSTPGSLSDSVESVKSAVLSILKDTVWPRRSKDTARDLLRTIENASSLKNIPKDNNKIQANHRASLDGLIAVMESAQSTLQGASNTYGTKERGLDRMKKKITKYQERSNCKPLLESCRNEVKKALASLPDQWNHEILTETHHGGSHGAPLGANTPLTGAVPTLGPAGGQVDLEASAVPQTMTSQSTVAAPSPDQDEVAVVPDDQFNDSSKRREWLSGVKTALNVVEGIAGTIPVAGTYVGAAAKTGATIIDIIQKIDGNEDVARSLASNALQLSRILSHFEDGSLQQRRGEFTKLMSNLQSELQRVQDRIAELRSTSVLKRAFLSSDHADALKECQETIQRLATFNTAALVTELYDEGIREKQRRLLDRLGDANYGARGDAIEDVICLEGTRVEILESINAWIRDASASEKVLWIRGMAGRGKSTIASTVAHQWKYQSASAIFHFRRGQNEGDKRLVCALARQLGSSTLVPELKESILQSVQENEDIGQGRLQEQFQILLIRSLARLQNSSLPILLVVDALDECADVNYAVNFVNLLHRFLPSLPVNVKVLLTTRPEAPLLGALEPKPWHTRDIDSMTAIDGDIERFLQHGFLGIRKQHQLAEEWPTQDQVRAIVHLSQGLFQWAQTAIQYMMEGIPEHRLRELLDLPRVCDGMDDLYIQILSKAFNAAKKSPQRKDIFLRILGTIVVAPYPISFKTLSFLYADHAVFHENLSDLWYKVKGYRARGEVWVRTRGECRSLRWLTE